MYRIMKFGAAVNGSTLVLLQMAQGWPCEQGTLGLVGGGLFALFWAVVHLAIVHCPYGQSTMVSPLANWSNPLARGISIFRVVSEPASCKNSPAYLVLVVFALKTTFLF